MKKSHFLTLLSKKLSGGVSPDEDAQLQNAIDANEAYRQIAGRLTAYFEHKDGRLTEMPLNESLKTTWEKIALAEAGNFTPKYNYKDDLKNSFFGLYWLKIAVIFVVILGCGIFTFNLLNRKQPLRFNTLSSANEKIFKTLDDGTRIYLNRGSSIRYNHDFGKKRREIFLEGEAFFDVARRKDVPLFIHAGNINIEVKGTAFNVNAYRKRSDIQVSLFRGLIAVSSKPGQQHTVLLKPNEKLIALAGSSASASPFHVIAIPRDKQDQEIKWTRDSLVFKKEKLKDLVIRLEKKYTIKIEIQNEELKHKRFSGTFAAEDLRQALEALKLSYPFNYTINDQLVIIK